MISPFSAPPYNLPIFLFGIYAQENAEAIQSLQVVSVLLDCVGDLSNPLNPAFLLFLSFAIQFTGLVGASAIADLFWMLKNEQSWFIKLVNVLILILKVSLHQCPSVTVCLYGRPTAPLATITQAPTFLAFASSLRSRGAQFSDFGGIGGLRGGDVNGPTGASFNSSIPFTTFPPPPWSVSSRHPRLMRMNLH